MPMKTVTFYRWQIAVAFIVLTGAFVAMGVVLTSEAHKLSAVVNRVAIVSQQNSRALCLRKADEQRTVRQSRAYLRTHPNGAPGIPKSLIERSIKQAQVALKSLVDVQCPPAKIRSHT